MCKSGSIPEGTGQELHGEEFLAPYNRTAFKLPCTHIEHADFHNLHLFEFTDLRSSCGLLLEKSIIFPAISGVL